MTSVADYIAARSRPAEGGCIAWTGTTYRGGYGVIQMQRGFRRAAHRAVYEMHRGPIPDGLTVDHICFNTACVNPAHLRLLTNRENAKRQRSAFKQFCVNGHQLIGHNVRFATGGRRRCRVCDRIKAARYREKKRRAALEGK